MDTRQHTTLLDALRQLPDSCQQGRATACMVVAGGRARQGAGAWDNQCPRQHASSSPIIKAGLV